MYTAKTKTVLALGPVKTDESEGYIPLGENVIHVLKKEKLRQKKYALEYGKAYKALDFVWCHNFGSPFDPVYLYNQFTKMLEDNNLRKIRFHDLRHTHATLLLRSHVDIKIVSQKLRHKKSSFTQETYQHVAEDMQQETANIMDEMFKAK